MKSTTENTMGTMEKNKQVNRFWHDVMLRVIKLLDAVMITLPFAYCWLFYYSARTVSPYYNKGNWLVIAIFFILFIVLGRVYEGFLVSLHKISEMVFSQALAILLSDGIMSLIIILLAKKIPSLGPMFLAFVMQVIMAIIWSFIAKNWYFHTFPPKRTGVVYDVRQGMERLFDEYGLTKKFNILYSISAEDMIGKKLDDLEKVEVLFLCGVHSHERNIILKQCVAQNITVYILPRIGDILMSSAKRVHIFHLPILRVNHHNPKPEYLFFKRLFDIVISALALVVLSPIMLVTAICIKVTDHGPVFYKQCRLTKNRRQFNILKFRSMRIDAEKDGVARLSTGENDDRITPVGRVIRKFRVDEIPQLINILKGEMSVVGPRPERPEIAAEYEETLPEFGLRLQAKAGLTGYAQVYGKYNTTPYDKLQMDLMYISKASFWEDITIVLATVKILFKTESTEGIAGGQALMQNIVDDTPKVVDGKGKLIAK